MDDLTFSDLTYANTLRRQRCYPGYASFSLLEWAGALCGEAGELANMLVHLRRGDVGLEQEEKHLKAVGKEIADVVIYADLLASALGMDLGELVRAKFNEVSRRVGSKEKL